MMQLSDSPLLVIQLTWLANRLAEDDAGGRRQDDTDGKTASRQPVDYDSHHDEELLHCPHPRPPHRQCHRSHPPHHHTVSTALASPTAHSSSTPSRASTPKPTSSSASTRSSTSVNKLDHLITKPIRASCGSRFILVREGSDTGWVL